MVKISSLDRLPQVIQSSNSFLQKLHRKQSNSFKTVCTEPVGDQDELQTIISAYLKDLHVSFPKVDLSAAFIVHNRKANINQRLFFLYCSTPTLLLAVNGEEFKKKKKNLILLFHHHIQRLSRPNANVHPHCMSSAQIHGPEMTRPH